MSNTKYEDMDKSKKLIITLLIIAFIIFLLPILLGIAYAAWSIYVVM